MSIYACLVFFTAWFVGSFVNGISGLGAAMLALPFISLMVGLDIAVPAGCLVGGVVSVFVAWTYRKDCMVKEVIIMVIGSLPGAALGTLALKMLPVRWLCLGLGALLLFFVLWQIYEQHRTHGLTVHKNPWYGFIAGCCGGFGNAAVSIGGPPLAICATLQNWDKDAARGTFGAYYMIMSCITRFSFKALKGCTLIRFWKRQSGASRELLPDSWSVFPALVS